MPITPDRPDGRSAGSEDPLEAAEATDDAARPEARRPSRETGWGYNPSDEDFDLVRETVPVAVRPEPEHIHNQPTVRVEPAARERETVRLPRQREPADARKRPPLLVAAAFATMWAALLSYLPVALVIGLARTLEGQGGLLPALHAGLAGWLLGHGVPVWTSIGPLGLAPLLLTLLAGWRLNRAGLHVTRAVGARRSGAPGRALAVGAPTSGRRAPASTCSWPASSSRCSARCGARTPSSSWRGTCRSRCATGCVRAWWQCS
jgi:hypothetical protein